jgi:hypothetical protein
MSMTIPVGSDFAIVDESDYALVATYSWWLNCNRYARTTINRKNVLMHRFILGWPSEIRVDHINRNGLDNRRSNLRAATSQQNTFNQKKHLTIAGRQCTSRHKGVCFRKTKGRWTSYIKIGSTRIVLGSFDTEDEAALAYNSAAAQHFGAFALLNDVA